MVARHRMRLAGWLRKLYLQIETLETMPERFGVIRESAVFSVELRELIHFSHRVIFTIDESNRTVRVVAVLHGAKDSLNEGDL